MRFTCSKFALLALFPFLGGAASVQAEECEVPRYRIAEVYSSDYLPTIPRDINNSGAVVGDYGAGSPFVTQNKEFHELPATLENSYVVSGINKQGSVSGSRYLTRFNGTQPIWQAIIWKAGREHVLNAPAQHFSSTTSGLNSKDMVVGSALYRANSATYFRALLWDIANGLSTPPKDISGGNRNSIATDINNKGTAIGFFNNGSGVSSFRWSSIRGFEEIGSFISGTASGSIVFDTYAYAINEDGVIAGVLEGNSTRAFVHKDQQFIQLELPSDAKKSEATDINSCFVVGHSESKKPISGSNSASDLRATLWNLRNYQSRDINSLVVNPASFTLESAEAINDLGEIVAFGFTGTAIATVVLKPVSKYDLTEDGVVDAGDAGVLFSNWGGAGMGDLNADGVVDAADLGLLMAHWTN